MFDFLGNFRRQCTPFLYVRCGWQKLRMFRFCERQAVTETGDTVEAYLVLESFPITKITACGYWISVWGEPKFVLKSNDGGKRWAYVDPVLALESYLIRKDWHIMHLKKKLRIACHARKLARKYAANSH